MTKFCALNCFCTLLNKLLLIPDVINQSIKSFRALNNTKIPAFKNSKAKPYKVFFSFGFSNGPITLYQYAFNMFFYIIYFSLSVSPPLIFVKTL